MFGSKGMSDSEPEEVPTTQAAPSGGPPKPPKKTAKGLEDGSGGGGPEGDVAERLIAEYTRLLRDPKLGTADRAKLEECLKEVQALRRKGE